MVIRIDQARLFKWLFIGLLAIEIAIVLLDAFISEFDWIDIGAAQRLVNITREDGIPNFFSSFQALAVGFVLLLITLVVRGQSRGSKPKLVLGWGVVTGAFIYMGIDDATKLHERLGSIYTALVTDSAGEPKAGLLGGVYEMFPSYSWQLVFGPLLVALGVFLVVFLLKQVPTQRLKVLILVALGMFAVAVATDFVEGLNNELPDRIADLFSTTSQHVIHFSKSVEELLEMVATTTFLYVFLSTLMSLTPSLTFEFNRRR